MHGLFLDESSLLLAELQKFVKRPHSPRPSAKTLPSCYAIEKKAKKRQVDTRHTGRRVFVKNDCWRPQANKRVAGEKERNICCVAACK
jgi:hypothetical protein